MTTVAVTGGNGTVGRAVLAELDDHRTVNLSRGERREALADAFREVDLLDAGEVYASLGMVDPDAVVHLGMLPTPERTAGHVTFESNAMTTYHVLEAARDLGVETVVLASSLSALGAGFEAKPVEVERLPVDESHPLAPTTAYGLGKQTLETVADGFGRASGPPRTVASLRFPWVTDDDDMRETFVRPDRGLQGLRESGTFHVARNTLFAYLHEADAARVVRSAIAAEFKGHERFWAVADDTTTATPSAEVAATVYPEAAPGTEFDGHEAFVSTDKAAELLGWRPERSWRDLGE